MKRIVIAIIFIAVAISIPLYSYFNLKSICDELTDALYAVADKVDSENNSETVDVAKKCVELWEDKSVRLEIYLDHSETEELELNIMNIERYAEGEYDIMLTEVCRDCINHLDHIMQEETPTWNTIF